MLEKETENTMANTNDIWAKRDGDMQDVAFTVCSEALGRQFARDVLEAGGRDALRAIRAKNLHYRQIGVMNACASHELWDANEIMFRSFVAVTGVEPFRPLEEGDHGAVSPDDCDLWNAGWAAADRFLVAHKHRPSSDPDDMIDAVHRRLWGH